MNGSNDARPEGEEPAATGRMGKLVLGMGCALLVLLALAVLAMFAWGILKVTSLPDYINKESVEAHYQEDLAKLDEATSGNNVQRVGDLDLALSDAVLAIYSQKVRVKRKITANSKGYEEKRDATGRKALYEPQKVTPKTKVTKNGIGYGTVLVDGQEVACVIVVRKPESARTGSVKVLGVNLGGRKRDYTEYLFYFRDTFQPN